ncbi:hypothetical protein ACI3E1_05750 [Ligilactobacillus sp. LYQ139]|uniref:hypothetical protein n=1 Tax=Ligilactobacillus sp. LYQ139 TaxID=3378800 RepID=UPI0038547F66
MDSAATKISTSESHAVMVLNAALVITSVAILFTYHFYLARLVQTITAFMKPCPGLNPHSEWGGFTIYAIFTYDGLESIGGVEGPRDKSKKPPKEGGAMKKQTTSQFTTTRTVKVELLFRNPRPAWRR